ncbi:hypothetical protein WA158_001612 [Blastocystis sp. Blastoise]
MDQISVTEKKYICDGIKQNIRTDGRTNKDYRKLELETSLIQQCHGSARVRTVNSGTDVLVAIKLEVITPDEKTPKCGALDVSVDFTASSSLHFRSREFDIESISLANKLSEVLMSSGAVDLESLCIIEKLFAWKLYIDIQILSDDGNLFDIIFYAINAALQTTRLPKTNPLADLDNGERDFEIDDDPSTYIRLNCKQLPLCITLSQISGKLVVDCSKVEEDCSSCALRVAVNKEGKIVSLQNVSGTISQELLFGSIEIANHVASALFTSLDKIVEKDDELWTNDVIPNRRGFFA